MKTKRETNSEDVDIVDYSGRWILL